MNILANLSWLIQADLYNSSKLSRKVYEFVLWLLNCSSTCSLGIMQVQCKFNHTVIFTTFVCLDLCLIFVKSPGCTSDGLACITVDLIPVDRTVECILDYISETGRDMEESQKVSMLR